MINKYDLNAIFVSGSGYGAPAVLSQEYLEGTYSEIYPDKAQDVAGMQRFFEPEKNLGPSPENRRANIRAGERITPIT
jgi:phosphoketolase